MNNWDLVTRGNMIVLVGDNATFSAFDAVREGLYPDQSYVGVTTSSNRYVQVLSNNPDKLDDRTLDVLADVNRVLDGVVSSTELEQTYVDQMCTTKDHIDNLIECHASMDSCEVYDVYENKYTAYEGTQVTIVYIRES